MYMYMSCTCISLQTSLDAAKHLLQGFSDVMVGDFLQSESQWREVFVVRDILERFLIRAR